VDFGWWRGEWMRFLESERSAARTTTSGWLTVLIALVGLFLTTVSTLADRGGDSALIAVSILFFLWAMTVAAGSAYAWAQYLGLVRSLSKRYLDPARPLSVYESNDGILQIDYKELTVRDVGDLFDGLWNQWKERESLHGVKFPRALVWANRIRAISLVTVFTSSAALLSSISLVLFAGSAAIVVALFTVATGYAAAVGLMMWRLVVHLGNAFDKERESLRRESQGADVDEDGK